MTKAYEKDKRFLETEKERRIFFHQTSPPSNTAVKDTNKNLKSTSNKTCPNRAQTRNLVMSKQVIEKLIKYKKSGIANQRNIARKDTT